MVVGGLAGGRVDPGRRSVDPRTMLERLGPSSLAGGSCGENQTHTAPVSAALGSIRRSVLLCTLLIATCLLVQVGCWTVAVFTDLRFEQVAADGAAPAEVVDADQRAREHAVAGVRGRSSTAEAADANRVYSTMDRALDHAATSALALGRLGIIALLPWVGLGVVLAVVTATDGVHRAVSGFGWAFVTALLVFPVAGWFGLPWEEGALWRYALLTEQVDTAGFAVDATFLATYLLLPLAALCTLMIGTGRFLSGIKDGLFRRENLRLDSSLESEAGSVEVGSLHAGRNAAALDSITRLSGEVRTVADAAGGAAGGASGAGDAGGSTDEAPRTGTRRDDASSAADAAPAQPPSRPLF